MNTNAWNLKFSKERLGIINKTEAQKRHLINILKARSTIDNRTEKTSFIKIFPSHAKVRSEILKDNVSMVKRIASIERLKNKKMSLNIDSNSFCKNMMTISTLHKNRKNR